MSAPVVADLPLSRVRVRADVTDPGAWFWELPVVAQLRSDGLALAPITVIVGENGSGKSTLVEAVARAWGASLTAQVKHWGPLLPSVDDSELHRDMLLDGQRPRPQGGVWLRAEAMHGHFAGMDTEPAPRAFDGVPLNARSHGEGFLAFLESRTLERGLWVLDEPESALSFRSSLRLMALLHGMAAAGSQVLLATHSPVLAALPGARVYELDGTGFTERSWGELDLVRDWQTFFDAPERLLRHLLDV